MDEDALIREQMEYYRARAPDYEATSSPPGDPLEFYGSQIDLALDQFQPTGKVLELASGPGGWTAHLLRHASSVTALDSSPEMHELSQRRIGKDPRVRFVLADVFSWEPDRQYDVVFLANWLSHVPPGRLQQFWDTVRDAVAPAGRVFVVDALQGPWRAEEIHHREDLADPPVSVEHRSVRDGRRFRVVKVYWNPEDLQSALGSMGWDVEVHTAGPFFWAAALPVD